MTGTPMLSRILTLSIIFFSLWIVLWAFMEEAYPHSIALQDGRTYNYSGLVSPSGNLCCGGHDCGPVEARDFRRDADGNIWIRRPGTYGEAPEGDWHEIAPESLKDLVLHAASPDGRVHACIWGHAVRCLLMPNGD